MLKSNGYNHPENQLKKFNFSLKTTFANIVKKLSAHSLLKSVFFHIFNFAHKCLTFAFTPEIEYTLGSPIKIVHSALHAETRGFTLVQPCNASDRSSSGKRIVGESGCTPTACVRFFRRRSLAGLRNTLFDLPMLHFSRSAHGDFCACEIGVVSLPPRTVNKTAHICFHS